MSLKKITKKEWIEKGLDADTNFDGIPTIGFAVSFPSSSNVAPEDANVKYVVNNIYYDIM